MIMDTSPIWASVEWHRPDKDSTPFLLEAFSDSSANEVILPSVWTYSFKSDELLLHEYRKRINDYERGSSVTGEWEYYKKIVNPYELVYTQKKYDNFPESVCLLHPLSRSYFKMVEIMEIGQFFKDFGKQPNTKLRSAHVCEGPGGFIEGFLDKCERNKMKFVQATAITLKPRQPNVPGWKRAAGFLKRNPNVRIEYGADGTGDLLHYENQDAFIAACGPGSAHLFTGDGGFDFSMDYDSQEQTIFPLLLASVRTGCEVLAPNGLFVLKFFDIYYPGTQDLLYFLSQHFQQWTLYKPATSRPCNPELYLVGLRFRPLDSTSLLALRQWSREACLKNSPPRLYNGPLPSSFTSHINSIIRMSVLKQITYLEKVFALLDSTVASRQTEIKDMLKRHEMISYQWCKAFNAPMYSERCHSIEASQTYPQASARR
jgi:23S rRNA U2552 (ribose-2'-O)-methylase RlmE/FtsJ